MHVIFTSFSIHMFVISHPNFEVLDEVFFTNFMRWFMLGIDHTPHQLPGLSFIVMNNAIRKTKPFHLVVF